MKKPDRYPFSSVMRLWIAESTSKSLGWVEVSAGRRKIGTSSMRYTVPGVLMPYVAVVNTTVAERVVGVSFGSRAMQEIDFSRSRAGWLKFAIGSHAMSSAASASPRARVSDEVYSPGLK